MGRRKKTNQTTPENQPNQDNSQCSRQDAPIDINSTTVIQPVQHQRSEKNSNNRDQVNRAFPAVDQIPIKRQQPSRRLRKGKFTIQNNPLADSNGPRAISWGRSNGQRGNNIAIHQDARTASPCVQHNERSVLGDCPNLGEDNFPALGGRKTINREVAQNEQAQQLLQLREQDQDERHEPPSAQEPPQEQLQYQDATQTAPIEIAPFYQQIMYQHMETALQMQESFIRQGSPHQEVFYEQQQLEPFAQYQLTSQLNEPLTQVINRQYQMIPVHQQELTPVVAYQVATQQGVPQQNAQLFPTLQLGALYQEVPLHTSQEMKYQLIAPQQQLILPLEQSYLCEKIQFQMAAPLQQLQPSTQQQQHTPPLQQVQYQVTIPQQHSPNQIVTPQEQLTNSQQQVQYQQISNQVGIPQEQRTASLHQATSDQQLDQQVEQGTSQQIPIQTDTFKQDIPVEVKVPHKEAQPQSASMQSTSQVKLQQKKIVRPQQAVPEADGSAAAMENEEHLPANFRRGGTQGRKIQVLANHFPLHLSPNITKAYQYDVTIEPEKPKSLLPIVMQQMKRVYYPNNNPAYDGMKNLISAYELPLILPFTGAVKIMDEEREKEYSVKIQLASIVDLTALTKFFNQRHENQMAPPMHVLQCLDIVLRSRPSSTMIIAGRSYFSVPDQIVKLGNGMEMYSGFYQSAILGWKPFLNVDVSHKAFPSNMTLLDLIKDIDRKADLSQNLSRFVENKLCKLIYNLKIEYKLPGNLSTRRTYRCHGLEKCANAFMFTNDKGKELSVTQYFQEDKKYKLKYPHFPCVWVGNKQRKPKVVLPMELCTLIGDQVTNRKMDDMQTRNIIRNATTSTYVRKDNIYHSMKVANHNVSPVMQEFGLSVDSNMTEVTARVLPPPTIKYSNCSQQVVKGVWKSGPFYSPATLNKWAILCLDPSTEDYKIQELKDHFVRQGKLWKMAINANAKTTRLNFDHISDDNIYNVLYQHFSQYYADQVQIIVVILNEKRTDSYNHVKRIAETATGCVTQCLRPATMQRLTLKTIDNILQKANVKLNGINFVWLERPLVMNRPTMIMGADVTHPGPDSRENSPSVAAVTASQDPQAVVYNIIWRLQDPRAEIIADLENITRCQLKIFYEKTHHKPEKIIFYRDGVSDGQFETVRKMEIQAVRKACTSLSPQYKPAITFLVVQKRHHTRLFPCHANDTEDKNGNVPAGTCVDTNVTHPISQDFYLVSHACVQGVAKPTKYRTLWDDSDLSDDQIEQLTYYLCHMFARCNRSVSYPAPTYYAHLAAARAKAYIDESKQDMSDLKKLHELIKITKEIQMDHPMFFV